MARKFNKNDLRKYFGMDVDDAGGFFKGCVYLEMKGRKYTLYRLRKGCAGYEDLESSWEVICETNSKDKICKHLFVYDEYETFNWWKPFDYEACWSGLNEFASQYTFAL